MTVPPSEHPKLAAVPVCIVAAATVALQLLPLALSHYGWFIDEFYYYACADRLAWGYVDHPPFSIFLLRIVRVVLGDSLVAARSVAAIVGAATIFTGGVMAQRLGAGQYGQLLAAVAVACVPVLVAISSFYSMNAFEVLIWSAASLLLIEILQGKDPRLWLLVGLLVGLGFLNKHTVVLFLGGLAIGVLLTSQRRVLRERWLWGGVAIAALVALPNLLWQVQHDWPSLEFYRNAGAKNVPTPPLQAALNQLLSLNPGSLPIVAVGIWGLVRDHRLRPLGVLVVVLLLLATLSGKSRPDRVAGLAPLMLAAGAAWWDRSSRRSVRTALLAAPLAIALVLSPVLVPILPPAQLARYAAALGVVPEIEAHRTALALPQWLADRLDWEGYVAAVENAVAGLPEDEKARAIVLTESYAGAGPLELLGSGLPPVYALHNNYHMWGPPQAFDVAVVVQWTEEELSEYFESVTLVSEFQCTWCRQFRHPTPIFFARVPKRPIEEVWPEVKVYR